MEQCMSYTYIQTVWYTHTDSEVHTHGTMYVIQIHTDSEVCTHRTMQGTHIQTVRYAHIEQCKAHT